jgi:hypothetical protein
VQGHRIVKVIFYIVFVAITTIGWVGMLYALVYWKLRQKLPSYIALFPWIVGAIYLVMALGLALNTGGVGLGEELVQRPFIWVYYVMIVWTCAGAYYCVWGAQWPRLRSAQFSIGIFLVAMLAVPATFSKDIQGHTGSATLQVPLCLYQTAQTLKQQTTRDILFQESGGDDSFALMALSNRQGYVVDFHGSRLPAVAQQRLAQLKKIQESKNPQALIDFMKRNEIDYFINAQNEPFAVSEIGALDPIYQCGAYTLYHLDR